MQLKFHVKQASNVVKSTIQNGAVLASAWMSDKGVGSNDVKHKKDSATARARSAHAHHEDWFVVARHDRIPPSTAQRIVS